MINVLNYNWPTMDQAYNTPHATLKRSENGTARVRRRLMKLGLSLPFVRRLSLPLGFFYSGLSRFGLTDIEIAVIQTRNNHDPPSVRFRSQIAGPRRRSSRAP